MIITIIAVVGKEVGERKGFKTNDLKSIVSSHPTNWWLPGKQQQEWQLSNADTKLVLFLFLKNILNAFLKESQGVWASCHHHPPPSKIVSNSRNIGSYQSSR